uniref:Uncharacterized protein n=1 Tax=Auxenochlorella protothecoides TaxID=3075 RepID=A0A1D1ZNF7_AUXPR
MSVRIPREKVSADKWAVSHSSDEAKRAKKRARQGVLSRTTSTVVEGTRPPHTLAGAGDVILQALPPAVRDPLQRALTDMGTFLHQLFHRQQAKQPGSSSRPGRT